ncbi:T9SS type A sorting domain-containing protein [Hymenobacter gummosus]|uniref:T9SS type A sorting domain-containing protein n=1 Tax=Hymenobacter gummosus TaxID=1776032 RepID=UPI0014045433|nr:T9SS type A sorting domain-containing protein [Hymenobacter gummosus]
MTVDANGQINGNDGAFIFVRYSAASTGTATGVFTVSSTTDQVSQLLNLTGNSAPQPTLTVNPTILPDFGSVQVGLASSPQSFTVNGSNLANSVTITPPVDFQVRIGSNPFTSSAISLTPTNGSLNNVQVDVRFSPTTAGATGNRFVQVTSPGLTRNVRVSGTGTSPATAGITANPNTINFGAATQSGSAGSQFFELSGTGLGSAPITLTPSNANIQVRNASAGTAFTSGALTVPSVNGVVQPTTIEVRLVSPLASGQFSGSISLTNPNVASQTVTVTAQSSGGVSDISITNPTNNSFTFATRPSTVSVSQSFLISGTNLLQPLVISPAGPNAGYFQVSSDNVNFSSTVSFSPDAQGNVTQRPVYVRFVPGSNALTINAIIRASSAPAPDRDVSVTGISEPTIRLSRALGFFGDAVVKNTASAPVTVRLETFLLTGPLQVRFPRDAEDPQRNPNAVPQFAFKLDAHTYSPTATYPGSTPPIANSPAFAPDYAYSDTLQNNSEGNRTVDLQVVYAPTRVGASAQELTFNNAALNGGADFLLNNGSGRAQGFAIATEPIAQANAVIVRPTGSTTATITYDFSAGNYGQNRLVIASSTYLQLPPSLFPRDKQNFNPGTTVGGVYQFGTGTAIEASTNTYVVFSGAATSFSVGNLNPNLDYYFFSFEFNDDQLLNAENYKVPNNQAQTPLPVELISLTAKLNNGRVLVDWATAQEKNNRGFEVQRSTDGENFTTLGFRAGKGNTTVAQRYSFEDGRPVVGTAYYRLKQIDLDGKVVYSTMAAVNNTGKGEVAVTVYPNPAVDKLNVHISNGDTDAAVVVTDLMGRTVLSGKLSSDGAFDVSNLKAGNYIVTVTSASGKTNHKIVKQ